MNAFRPLLVMFVLIATTTGCKGKNIIPKFWDPSSNDNGFDCDNGFPDETEGSTSDDANGTIHGFIEIVDFSTGPIPDTLVEVFSTDNYYCAITNEEGEYSIRNVVPGRYVVSVMTKAGDTDERNVEVYAGKETRVDFTIYTVFPSG